MDDHVTYTSPEVVDYGSLSELTADMDHLNLSMGVVKALAGASVMSAPLVPGTTGGDGGGPLSSQGIGTGTTSTPSDGSAVLPTSDQGGALGGDATPGLDGSSGDDGGSAGAGGSGSGGSGSGGGGGADAGGRLPFTGLSVALIAGVGAGIAGAGASLRAHLRRGEGPAKRF